MFSKNDVEVAVSFIASVMALEAHGHMNCLGLMLFRRNKSLRAGVEMVENVESDPE